MYSIHLIIEFPHNLLNDPYIQLDINRHDIRFLKSKKYGEMPVKCF